MLRTDAAVFFRHRIAHNALLRIHVYFPDPWPKTRHLKRRILQPSFVTCIHHILRIGGQLAIVTDHVSYARQIHWVVLSHPGFAVVPFPRTQEPVNGMLVGTNFERKYLTQGRRFHSLAVMKWR